MKHLKPYRYWMKNHHKDSVQLRLPDYDVNFICIMSERGFSAAAISYQLFRVTGVRLRSQQVYYIGKRNDAQISGYRNGTSKLARARMAGSLAALRKAHQ